jgi:hypothetical protein
MGEKCLDKAFAHRIDRRAVPGDYSVDKALFAKGFAVGVYAIQHSISIQDKSIAGIELDCTLGERHDSSQANNRPSLPQLDHLTTLTQ